METTVYLGKVQSFAQGRWHTPAGEGRPVFHAVTGEPIAEISSEGLDFKGMLDYARTVGGPKLRQMTFHERARMLKALALYLNEHKAELYELSRATGATKQDAWLDIDGGIGTFFVYASKGRRELPDERFLLEGEPERISRRMVGCDLSRRPVSADPVKVTTSWPVRCSNRSPTPPQMSCRAPSGRMPDSSMSRTTRSAT